MFTVSREFSQHVARTLAIRFRNTNAIQKGDSICFTANIDEDTVRRICERAFCEMRSREEYILRKSQNRKTGRKEKCAAPLFLSEAEASDPDFVRCFTCGAEYFVIHAAPEFTFVPAGAEAAMHTYAVFPELVPYVERVLDRSFYRCEMEDGRIRTDCEAFSLAVKRAYCEKLSEENLPLFYVTKEEEQKPVYLNSLIFREQSHGYVMTEVDAGQLFSRIA